MTFATNNDIDLAIQVLRIAIDKTNGTYTNEKIKAPLNRVIFDLEEIKKKNNIEVVYK